MQLAAKLTFTEIMYAIVKNVVKPARSSVVNFVFLISKSFKRSVVTSNKNIAQRTHMT
jgi:hypothetical protein